jgi:hypothetical protein
VPVKHIIEFKENLRVLLISTLFILLAARLQWEDFTSLGWSSLAFVAGLILIVRPVAVALATIGAGLSWQERVFLAWMAPRGIVAASVASVFALHLGAQGEQLVPVTFLTVVVTVAVYGLTAAPLAYRLGLAVPNPQGILLAGAHASVRAIGKSLKESGFAVLLVDSNRNNVSLAKMDGLPALYGGILSSEVLEEMNLGGIGRLLAMTPNDEVNTLAALEFREVFGRAEVYQLRPASAGRSRTESELSHLHGRFLFHDAVDFAQLAMRIRKGATIKRTNITEEFDFAAFRDHHGESATPLFIVTQAKALKICVAGETPKPQRGQTLISLVDRPAGEGV